MVLDLSYGDGFPRTTSHFLRICRSHNGDHYQGKEKEKNREEKEGNLEKLKQLADTLKNVKVVLKLKEKKGKLFGSVSKKKIAETLVKENLNIAEENIILENPIKKTGLYEIEIELARDIRGRIKLEIVGE